MIQPSPKPSGSMRSNNVEETIDECIRSIRYALSDDHCISEEAVKHLKHYIKQERRAAAEAMREECATVVQNWHIRKGGYTELSHVLRSIDTPDDGRG